MRERKYGKRRYLDPSPLPSPSVPSLMTRSEPDDPASPNTSKTVELAAQMATQTNLFVIIPDLK